MSRIYIKNLSEEEMQQIKGGNAGEKWVCIDGIWYSVSGLSLEEEDTPPPPNP